MQTVNAFWEKAGRVLVAAVAFGLFTPTAPCLAVDGLGAVVVKNSELPKGWGFVKSVYSVSLSASDVYENYEHSYQDAVGANLAAKQFQSFLGPARGTVFYLGFADAANAAKAADFAKRLIWEGDARSSAHPERIFTVGSTLVIISIADGGMADAVEKILRSREGSQ